ncbi:acetylglutamate kinase [Candidatus Endolissoclinum faulkneri L5]|uniref:Acetylglutamate kinase n=1 Tax=Candidatus Endolissoclinum faulkneri L5 TaxID=1401328 RepID=V9TUT2_9PROT|nr:acetylglutamate kinase [Candidatus Endolissoclinum faulkneri]AHC73453.1 acetylglutamate kinase [Candidatus Endolissoclinum faulkneri L5]
MTSKSVDLKRQTEWLSKANILTEALPFMRRYSGKTIVIKYGGHAMGDIHLALKFAADMVLLQQVGMNPVVVHGGGPQISHMLERLNIKSKFIDGLRMTDQPTVEVIEMVLSGFINKSIVSAITQAGGKAIGLSGKDAGLIQAKKLFLNKVEQNSKIKTVIDLGFVGEPNKINACLLRSLALQDLIPVVAPIGLGYDGKTYNINADTAAGAIAAAVDASRFMLLTDLEGVLDKNGCLIPELTISQARRLIDEGVILDGMIPKVKTCIKAVESGAEGAVIIDGRVQNGVLLELFTNHGMGTWIRSD